MSELDNISGISLGTPIEEEKSDDQKTFESEEQKKDFALAALVDHPGWKQIEEMMVNDVEDLNSGRSIDVSKYTNEELGEVFRSDRVAAVKLQSYYNKVREAVNAVGQYNQRKQERN